MLLSTKLQEFIVASVLTALAFVWYQTIDVTTAPNADLVKYITMAQAAPHITPDVPSPFLYRILPTWLPGVITQYCGLQPMYAFMLVTFISIVAIAVLLYRRILLAGVPTTAAWLSIAVLLLNPYIMGFSIYNPYQTCDTIGILLILLMIDSYEKNRFATLAIYYTLGSCTREPLMLVAIPAVLYAFLYGSKRTVIATVLACVPGVVCFIAIRQVVVPTDGIMPSMIQTVFSYMPKVLQPQVWFRLVLTTFTPVSLALVLTWKVSRSYLRDRVDLIALVILIFASTFLGGDVERLFAPALVVVYVIVALIFKHMSATSRYIVLAISVLASLHHEYARFSPLSSSGYILIFAACTIAIGVVGYLRVGTVVRT